MSGWGGAWSAVLKSLRIPQDATPTQPQVILGGNLPQPFIDCGFQAAIIWSSAVPPKTNPNDIYYAFSATKDPTGTFATTYNGWWRGGTTRLWITDTTEARILADGSAAEFIRFWGGNTLTSCPPGGIPDYSWNELALNKSTSGGTHVHSATLDTFDGASQVDLGGTTTVRGDTLSLQATYYSAAGTASINTNSDAFVTFSNIPAQSIFKFYDETRTTLEVTWMGGFFVDPATGARFGVRINGNDYLIDQMGPTLPTTLHTKFAGQRRLPASSAIGAGNLTVTPIWSRYPGTPNFTASDQQDYHSLIIKEVPIP